MSVTELVRVIYLHESSYGTRPHYIQIGCCELDGIANDLNLNVGRKLTEGERLMLCGIPSIVTSGTGATAITWDQ